MLLNMQHMQLLQQSQPLQLVVSLVAGPHAPEKVLKALDSVQQDDHKATNSPAASKLHSAFEELGWLLQITSRQEHVLLRLILAFMVALAMRRLLHAARAVRKSGSTHRPPRQHQHQHLKQQEQHGSSSNSSRSNSSSSNSSSVHAAVPSVRFKDVRILKPLGEGSYATVYAAYWNCQALILKRPKEGNLQLMLKEAEMMEHSRHSHVVQLLGVCHDPPALLMQWCKGGSLAAPVQAFRQSADAATVCQLLHDVAAAVCCFHSEASRNPQRALVHLDLRAPNVLLGNRVGPHWDAKLTDFGLAEWLGPDGTAVVGHTTNHLWVAPEVLQPMADLKKAGGSLVGPMTVSRASEVWMFGMLMLEVLTGQVPYAEQLKCLPASARKAMMGVWSPCHEFGRPQLPGRLQYDIPIQHWAQLQDLYDACTAMQPEDRPSMQEVHERLKALCAQQAEEQLQGMTKCSSGQLLLGRVSYSVQAMTNQPGHQQPPQQALLGSVASSPAAASSSRDRTLSTQGSSVVTAPSVGPPTGASVSTSAGGGAVVSGRRWSSGTGPGCIRHPLPMVGSLDQSPFARAAAPASPA